MMRGIPRRARQASGLVSRRLAPARPSLPHFRLGLDAERVGDAVDVIEIADHFHGVQDVAVVEAVPAQGFDVPATDRGGRAGDQFGEFGQRLFPRREPCAKVVVLDVLGKLGVFAFLTEILSVRFDSIEAVVGPRDHGGQKLAFGAR